jgi:predicted RNA-binding Zn ribbon-like protein
LIITVDSALWEELVNSDRHDYLGTGRSDDQLADPKWVDGFLKRWSLDARGLDKVGLVKGLARLRGMLQRNAERLAAGRPLGRSDLKRLDDFLRASPLIRKIEPRGQGAVVGFEPVRRTVASVLAEIAFAFAETVASGEPGRIRVCGNADCRWIFDDRSKSGGRKWCGSTCGNLMKVRRFRRRHKRP